MIERLDINFGWRFSPDFKQEYTKPDFKDNAFRLVDVPHSVCEMRNDYFSEKQYHKISCYRKMVMLPPKMKKRRLILHFEGVMGCAAVFVNGKPVIMHKGGFTPFECDVTDFFNDYIKDSENLITVAVDSFPREDTAPFGGNDGPICCGGIYREVWLEACDPIRLKEVFALPVRSEDGSWSLRISGSLDMGKNAKKNGETEINFCLHNGEERLAATYHKCIGESFNLDWKLPCAVEEWNPQRPKIYQLGASIGTDEKLYTIGFRTVELKPDGFYINGSRQVLWGVARTQNFPRVGSAMPVAIQRLDAEMIAEMGFNCVRTFGAPPSPAFLERCDSLGLLVINELPGNGYLGQQEWKECLLDNMKELIVRDRNHPSVIAWGTQVENTYADSAFSDAANSIAKSLDGSRPTISISNKPASADMSEDIFGYNEYHSGAANSSLEKKRNITKSKKPVLRTSLLGANTLLAGSASAAEQKSSVIDYAYMLDSHLGDKEFCGFCGAYFSDYITSHGTTAAGLFSGGITTSGRAKKKLAALLESQNAHYPVLELLSSIYPEDYSGSVATKHWILTNCDSVKLYRNGAFVKEFFPDRKAFPNLPHPPILVDDFLGDLTRFEDGLSEKGAVTLKNALTAMWSDNTRAADTSVKAKAFAGKYKLQEQQLASLYDKYLGNSFGGAALAFEGIKNSEVLASIVLEPVKETGLQISCSKQELFSGVSYDCVRVELRAIDQNGNTLAGCNRGVCLDCEGSIEILGPKIFSLENGCAVFFVRSRGGKGRARVKIATENLGNGFVDLNVVRKSINV